MTEQRPRTRREFLRVGGALGIGVLGLAAAACSTAPAAPTAAPTVAPKPTTAPAPAPAASAAPAASPALAASPAASPSTAASPAASPAVAASPAASAASEAALVDAAKREGRGLLYATTDPSITTPLLAAFKSKYGVDVDFQRLTSGPLVQKFSGEADAGAVQADMLVHSDIAFTDQAIAKGWIAKIDSFPSLSGWPSQFWTGTYATVALLPASIAWNTQRVPDAEAPKGWQDLLDPKWKGQILFNDPRNSLSINLWLYAARQAFGEGFLRSLGGQDLQFAPSAVPGAQQLAAGASAFFIPAIHTTITPLVAQGAPLKEIWPAPTTSADQLAMVPAKAPHPNIGRLLLDFHLSPEGQAILNKDAWSPLPNVPGTLPIPPGFTTVKYQDAVAAEPQMWPLLGIS